MIAAVLVRVAYLAVSHAFAALWLLRMTDRDKDVEILAPRHQLAVLQRQLGDQRPRSRPEHRALFAALLVPLGRATLRRLRLLVNPDTVLRWHRDLMKRHHARTSVNRGPGRPCTVASIRVSSCTWQPRTPRAGIDGSTANDRDAKYPALIDKILGTAGIDTVPTGVRMPRMNSIMERWVRTLRAESLNRTLIWNQAHRRHALREYERYYSEHRTHRSLAAAAPLQVRPQPLEPDQIERFRVERHDRLGGVIHEYRYAA
ncbi:transposase [Lentzea sp. HUAS12]|uniref:transposase n=1 Tax=Lentzea sp. HUAS12 TaxID=2951806 RepID=UPI00209F612B|nr:transposase [Lentzea sp. HUAS12]USX54120.1 transposase [Lentzea sp. HUAS12]